MNHATLPQLADLIDGELLLDDVSRTLYSTDASIYRVRPAGVVRPRHRDDCVAIVAFAAEQEIPLIFRAAGTSLAGQCVGSGLVVDISRHMGWIGEVDVAARRVTVGPGVILDDLNDHLAEHGLMFGPDTSTSNRCMIGGMIGNNSCGTHSIIHGTTRDHVLSIEAVLADGSLARFGPVTPDELAQKRALESLEGAIYRSVCDAVDAHHDAIIEAFPRREIVRRNTGFPLDLVAEGQPWNPDGPPLNLAQFLSGTEGTLALITEATLNLVPPPTHKLLVCAHFASLDEAMRSTVVAVAHAPAAVELMDRIILEQTRGNLEQARNRFWVEGDPAAVLAIEFYDDDPDTLTRRAQALIDDLQQREMGYAFPVVRPPDLGRVWSLRKAGLGILMGKPGDVKAETVIEDTAVAVVDLPQYVRDMATLIAKYETQCVYYAHVSVGELHLRPELNLKNPEDLRKFKGIAEEVATLVKKYGGSLSGEHGDGRLRGPFVEQMLGSEVFGLLREIKDTFDPQGIFNPGKIIDTDPIDTNLRTGPDTPQPEFDTIFDWSADMGLLRAVEKCNGAGVCRKSAGRGVMCPTYVALKEESAATRGRANLFREVLTHAEGSAFPASDELKELLDLCVSCKGCKSECPANVDMARLKAEFLQHYYDAHSVPLRSRLFGEFGRLTKLAVPMPGLASEVLNLPIVKKALGVHPKRSVPTVATETFGRWSSRHRGRESAPLGPVVLFADAFTHYNDPHVGIAATEVLEAWGYRVLFSRGIESGRTQISKGLLRSARGVITRAVKVLDALGDGQLPIIGLEPSALLTFRDEAPDLVSPEHRAAAERVAARALLFEEFVAREADAGRIDGTIFDAQPRRILLHGHCHQKALAGTATAHRTLNLLPETEVEEIPSGCCGMAGSFGYEEEHYDLSMRIGEQILFPAVRAADVQTIICASGTSCRHQIHDGTARQAKHPVEILHGALRR